MDRFWSKVEKSGDCWVWKAGLDDKGYGQFRLYGKNIKAHRAAWIITYGENPSEDILHSCDNSKCVKPEHLRLGSDSDNMLDSLLRERRNLIYSNDQVSEMRLLANDGWTRQQIVEKFGGTRASVTLAVTGKTYSHIATTPSNFSKRDKRKSKLTLEEVKEIKRQLLVPYHGQNKRLCALYGLSPSEISQIKHGHVYRDVSPD